MTHWGQSRASRSGTAVAFSNIGEPEEWNARLFYDTSDASPYSAHGAPGTDAPSYGALSMFAPSSDGSREDYSRSMHLAGTAATYAKAKPAGLPHRSGSLDLSWFTLAQCGEDRISTTQLGSIVDGLNTALKSDRIYIIDLVMDAINLRAMSLDAMSAFLRVTFPARERIRNWMAFRAKVKEELDRRGQNSDRFLRGLA